MRCWAEVPCRAVYAGTIFLSKLSSKADLVMSTSFVSTFPAWHTLVAVGGSTLRPVSIRTFNLGYISSSSIISSFCCRAVLGACYTILSRRTGYNKFKLSAGASIASWAVYASLMGLVCHLTFITSSDSSTDTSVTIRAWQALDLTITISKFTQWTSYR